MAALLAVDIGLKTGLACYAQDGRLHWYRSQHFGSAARLRRAVHGVLDSVPELLWLVLEGGGALADIWKREAARRQLAVRQTSAEVWRQHLLYARQQRSGAQAKEQAIMLARQVIAWSQARRPTSLQHDAAEAILLGLWAVREVGWLAHFPDLRPYGTTK
ncbi:MAG: hypothetical protein AB7N91_23400 [Candidatus Tectimicrobiota bacterium]